MKKQVVSKLVSICFGSPWLGLKIKTNCMNLQVVDPEISSVLIFFKEGFRASFTTTCCEWFFKKFIMLYSIYWKNLLPDCLYLILYIWQYVYCNCFSCNLWRHKFWRHKTLPRFPLTWPEIQNKIWNHSRTMERAFKVK